MVEIKIDESVTQEQRSDPRFRKLLADSEAFFNSPESRNYKLLLGLHEAGHIFLAIHADVLFAPVAPHLAGTFFVSCWSLM